MHLRQLRTEKLLFLVVVFLLNEAESWKTVQQVSHDVTRSKSEDAAS